MNTNNINNTESAVNNNLPTALEMLKTLRMGKLEYFVHIDDAIITELKDAGRLTEIGENKSQRTNNKYCWDNIYYRVEDMNNTVLMHIGNNEYAFLSEKIYCKATDEEIEIVPIISKLHFCLGGGKIKRRHIMTTHNNTSYYFSLELYGEIRNLDKDFDVHHKGATFDNRQGMVLYISRENHRHKNYSHKTGEIIDNILWWNTLCKTLERDFDKWNGVNVVM